MSIFATVYCITVLMWLLTYAFIMYSDRRNHHAIVLSDYIFAFLMMAVPGVNIMMIVWLWYELLKDFINHMKR